MATEELDLDPSFTTIYQNDFKKKKSIDIIILRVQNKLIKVTKAAKVDSVPKLVDLLDDLNCCYIVFCVQGESEDGLIRMERHFTITYTPPFARPDEKVVYEMQKGKQISKATRGAIELHVGTKEDLRRKVNAVSFGVSRAKKDESDDEDHGNDWMDD